MTQQNPFAGCAPPAVKPIDRCQRGQYETSKASFNDTTPPTAPWEKNAIANSENGRQILAQPGSLMFLNAVFSTALVVPAWVLLFDLDAAGAGALDTQAIARYSFGPGVPDVYDPNTPTITSGACITYEAQAEQVYNSGGRQRKQRDGDDREAWSFGIPFNFGITVVASSSPRIYVPFGELVTLEWALTARFQT